MGSIDPKPAGFVKDRLLILLPTDPRPDVEAKLKEKCPDIEVQWFNTQVNGAPIDPNDVPRDIWEGVTIVSTYRYLPPADLTPNLRLVQLVSSGADHCATSDVYKNPRVTFCTSNGVHPPQIAEWVIGTWLAHQHEFTRYTNHMKDGYWEPPYQSNFEDSTSLKMGILGYGAIGRQCARIATSLGMEVLAYTLRERSTPESRRDDSYCVPGTGDPDGLLPSKWFHGKGKEAVNHFLEQDLDILVICLPLTPDTRGLISKEQFQIMAKKKTFLSNVGRGPHVNTTDLIEALESGMIRGAALDVTDPEPLPKDHPLWKAPNVFITPHVSWRSNHHWQRTFDILLTNIQNLREAKPMINTVNKHLHY